jgi:zinc and cadmium transporter
MDPNWLLVIYCVLVVVSSMAGGALPTLFKLTHLRMQCLLSLVGGFVLGVALLHMIPHGVAACQSLDLVIHWTLIGLLFTFFLIRLFHFHQHGSETQSADEGHDCENHDHHHDGANGNVSWTGVLLGLSVHTLVDGIAMGAAVMTDSTLHHNNGSAWPYGFGVFLAVFLHKPLDALSITGLMSAGGWSDRARRRVNLGYALMCPLGAVSFVFLASTAVANNLGNLLGMGLGLSAGAFLCISLSDLLPELQFHRHDRGKLSSALLLGVALAYAIGFLEDPHTHGAHNHDEPAIHNHEDAGTHSH